MYKRGFSSLISIIVVALLIVGGGVYYYQNNSQPEPEASDGEFMMEEMGGVVKAGSYEAYSPEKLALAENGDVVLFFYASWCPFCRSAEADINQNLASIPKGVHILKTDYDKQTALKQKYGVTYQHTFVQVDSRGDLIKKWAGSENLEDILNNIQ